MAKAIAYLGPGYSFCEEAASSYTGLTACEMLACPSIEAVFSAVDSGEVLQGIVPIENSCEGSVNQTLDLLAYDYNLKIVGEVVIPVQHNLLVKPETECAVTHILSHPQALAQCRKTIARMYPEAELREVLSTAEAARQVAQAKGYWGAIASKAAASAYRLRIKNTCFQDIKENETRFIVIAREGISKNTACKTSLIIHTLHQPGALYRCLQEFSIRGINLNKIESRPARTQIGQYLFFIDIDGHTEDCIVAEALAALYGSAEEMRILGSYPAYGPTVPANFAGHTLSELRQRIDELDEQLVNILGQRSRVVEQVAKHKKQADNVKDTEREKTVLKRLAIKADQNNLDPMLVNKIYNILFNYFSEMQVQNLRSRESSAAEG